MTEHDTPRKGEVWVLVPRVPTPEMLNAAYEYALAEDAAGVWKAMIDTALEQRGLEG